MKSHLRHRERAYAALKYDPGSCQNAKRARLGVFSEPNERRGPVFRLGGEALRNIEGDVAALKPEARRLWVAWCRRESVKGDGRDALNGMWERDVGTTPKNSVEGRRFLPPSDSTQLLVVNC